MTTLSFPAIQREAREIGLNALGIVSASESFTYPLFAEWADSGQAGDMDWLINRKEARRHPDSVLKGVKTILVGALTLRSLQEISQKEKPFFLKEPHNGKRAGSLLPYSVCLDYHDILRAMLKRLADELKKEFPEEKFRTVVDTAPILEKEWGVRAGLGKIARNSLLLHPEFGTEFFLGILLTTIPAESFSEIPQIKAEPDPCAKCDRCIAACPVGALNPNRTLNASRCLNYWLIEYRGETFPEEIQRQLGDRFFGCDTCRRVCPKNQRLPEPVSLSSEQVGTMTPEEFQALFKGTPIERLGWKQFLRNYGKSVR